MQIRYTTFQLKKASSFKDKGKKNPNQISSKMFAKEMTIKRTHKNRNLQSLILFLQVFYQNLFQ